MLTRPPWNLKNPAPPLKPANATKIGRALHVARDAQVSLPPFVPCQQRVKDGFKYIYKKERERKNSCDHDVIVARSDKVRSERLETI